MSTYGFIITRHVNSDKTNQYWNQCVKLIRKFYPLIQIIIIDDNSNTEFVKSDFEYTDLTIIQSEYPKRGELLPYIYYLKYISHTISTFCNIKKFYMRNTQKYTFF